MVFKKEVNLLIHEVTYRRYKWEKVKKRIYLGLTYHYQIFFQQFGSSLVSNGLHAVIIHEKAANRKQSFITISYHNQFW